MATTTRSSTLETLKKQLIGPRLLTVDAPHQTVGKKVGSAVCASDALSSTADAADEILFVLVLAGAGALSISIPIAIAIVILIVAVPELVREHMQTASTLQPGLMGIKDIVISEAP